MGAYVDSSWRSAVGGSSLVIACCGVGSLPGELTLQKGITRLKGRPRTTVNAITDEL